MPALLRSIQAGRSRVVSGATGPWTTAFWKTPVEGPVQVGLLGLEGDEQADRSVHGGLDKEICVYAARHLPAWKKELGLKMGPGAFGENFTVAGQTERDIAIGDVYAVGDALVQVSQPRGPCGKLARRWNRPDLPRRVVATGRTGWYMRVIREGRVAPGDPIELVGRATPLWTIARVNELMYAANAPSDTLAALASCPELARGLRVALARRVLVASERATSEPRP